MTEVSEAGSVPELLVKNPAPSPVLEAKPELAIARDNGSSAVVQILRDKAAGK